MNTEEINESAIEIVYDHLINGVEYLTISETLGEERPDEPTDEDVDAVYERVHTILSELSNHVSKL